MEMRAIRRLHNSMADVQRDNYDETTQSGTQRESDNDDSVAFVDWLLEQTPKPEFKRLIHRMDALLQLDWTAAIRKISFDKTFYQLWASSNGLKQRDQRASRTDPRTITASFLLNVDVRSYLKQYYGNDTSKGIKSIIVLIGTGTNAQAVVCSRYMERLWSLRGKALIDLIDLVVAGADVQGI